MDASGIIIGATLVQKQNNGKFQLIQFGSRKVIAEKRRYSTFEQGTLVTVFALKKVRHNFLRKLFLSFDEHRALKTAFAKADNHKRIACRLSPNFEYDFQIRHLPGDRNVIADYLSRSIEARNAWPMFFTS